MSLSWLLERKGIGVGKKEFVLSGGIGVGKKEFVLSGVLQIEMVWDAFERRPSSLIFAKRSLSQSVHFCQKVSLLRPVSSHATLVMRCSTPLDLFRSFSGTPAMRKEAPEWGRGVPGGGFPLVVPLIHCCFCPHPFVTSGIDMDCRRTDMVFLPFWSLHKPILSYSQ